jgi:hypothetical protein
MDSFSDKWKNAESITIDKYYNTKLHIIALDFDNFRPINKVCR